MKNKDSYQQPHTVISDERFQTCVKYANFISEFFDEHQIVNWELAGVKARFPIDKKFCSSPENECSCGKVFDENSVEDFCQKWNCPMLPKDKDKINPDHYKVGGIETFDILRAKLSPTQLAGFCKGNVIKYVTRADHKDKVDDLKKAMWYLDKLIEELDGKATR